MNSRCAFSACLSGLTMVPDVPDCANAEVSGNCSGGVVLLRYTCVKGTPCPLGCASKILAKHFCPLMVLRQLMELWTQPCPVQRYFSSNCLAVCQFEAARCILMAAGNKRLKRG